ncbi:MAG: hypothetical protein E6Q97_25670 [Desulfurellales bacterium]|nr:MAG: hypothetical protein E6Q97_25670 [Desulfurellales bacterium]
MAGGHVRLGLSAATLRDYMLANVSSLAQSAANPFAAKIGSGAGKYEDFENYAAWVMEDWQAGAGLEDAESGGYLFGTVDSRVPHQLILPPAQGVGWDVAFNSKQRCLPTDLTSFGVTKNSKAAGVEVAWQVNAKVAYTVSRSLWLYAKIPDGATVTVKWYNAANTTLLETDTYTAETISNGHQWYVFDPGYNVAAGTDYYVRVSVNATWEVFTADQYSRPFFIFQIMQNGLLKMVRFNGNLYGFNQSGMFKWNGTYWAAVAGAPAVIDDAVVYNSKLYLGRGSGNFYTMSTGEAFTDSGLAGRLFCQWNGYLYRTATDAIYYTADGTTWSGPFKAEPGAYIWAMAGMQNDLYFSNQNGVYRLAAGDVVVKVYGFGKVAQTIGNGYVHSGMVNWQGDLYVAVDSQIVRYSANGQVTEIWLKDHGDLGSYPILGTVTSLQIMNNYLVASISGASGGYYQHSVWAWNRQGWHPLAILPQTKFSSQCVTSMYFDRTLDRLWVGNFLFSMFVYVSDMAKNPYIESLATPAKAMFLPSGWFESAWFDGALMEMQKYLHSIYVVGENIAAGTAVDVWYKVGGGSWVQLGTATATETEMEWSGPTGWVAPRRVKIGMLMRSTSVASTPRVQAMRLKFLPVIGDRARWQLSVMCHDNQQMANGAINAYNMSSQVAHIKSLITSQVPIIFEDVDGLRYAVFLLQWSRQVVDWEWLPGASAATYKVVYNLSIEQPSVGTYAGA